MGIFEIIEEFADTITPAPFIHLAGLILFGIWLLRTSWGIRALSDSMPRRNSIPLYLPFIALIIWLGSVSLTASIIRGIVVRLGTPCGGDLEDWQSAFLDHLIICVVAIAVITVIILIARVHFARRLKGFGLDIKTIFRDFFAAFINLLAVWPLMEAALLLTLYVGKLIWGADYQIEPHDALESITQYSQLPVRISIVVVAVVAAPVVEELIFRGMLQTMIRSYLSARRSPLVAQGTGYEEGAAERSGAWPAIIISSALFASIHAIPAHWPALFILGVCLGYSYEKSGSLLRPFFIHSFFNAIMVTVALSQ